EVDIRGRRAVGGADPDGVGGFERDVGIALSLELANRYRIATDIPVGKYDGAVAGPRQRGVEIPSCSSAVDDEDVGRVEQQVAPAALRRAGIDVAREDQRILARDFDEAAVAGLGAAAGADGAVELGAVVGPDRDMAAVAGIDRVGVDDGVARDVGFLRVLLGAEAVEVAANQDGAAAGVAGGVDARAVEEADVLAEHLDGAAGRAGLLARNV